MARLAAALAVLVFLAAAPAAQALTYTVASGGDALADDGVCTLREAVIAIDNQTATGGCPAGDGAQDTIRLGVPKVTLAQTRDPFTDTPRTGDVDLLAPMTIEGQAGGTTIDGAGLDRVFDVVYPNIKATLRDVTVTGGRSAPGAPGLYEHNAGNDWFGDDGAPGDDGGGIRNAGRLVLEGVTVTSNQTGDGGAGRDEARNGNAYGGSGAKGGSGGGIASSGTLTVTGGAVTDNRTGAGGIGGTGQGGDVTVDTNQNDGIGGRGGLGGDGGGIYSTGPATIDGTTLSGNRTGAGGKGASGAGGAGKSISGSFPAPGESGGAGGDASGGTGGNGGRGGGIAAGSATMTVTRSLVLGNGTGGGAVGGRADSGPGGNSTILATVGNRPHNGGAGGDARGGTGGAGGSAGGISATYIGGGGNPPAVTVTATTVAANTLGTSSGGGDAVGAPGGSSKGDAGGSGGDGFGGKGGDGAGGGAGLGGIVTGLGTLDLLGATVSAGAPGGGGTGGHGIAFGGGGGATPGAPGAAGNGAAGLIGTGGALRRASLRGTVVVDNIPGACAIIDMAASANDIASPGSGCPGRSPTRNSEHSPTTAGPCGP